ncbi:MAG: hypothetical protein WAW90_03090 [Minisyncoccia bacterium]
MLRNTLTNLLPQERRDALSRDYFFRLSTVVMVFFTALVIVAAALLAPTYIFLMRSASAKQAHLTSIQSTLSSTDGVKLSASLDDLSNDVAILIALSNVPSATRIISSVIAISRPGIVLSGFSYTSASGKGLGTLALSGTAETRNALRGYQIALQEAPFASSVSLPVSAYAKDANIDFVITITLVP